ncbi:g11466 [Coccomyxa elongata]
MFTNETYGERTYKVGEHSLRLLCSPAASTDYDLTGQIMWPAAQLLAEYLAANPSIMTGCQCALELGSGLGLPGLLCAQFCPVILTDHNEVVLRVLKKNADLNRGPHSVRCEHLDWSGDAGSYSSLLAQSPNRQGFELLLGSDVAYSLKALPSLFKAASLLLSMQPHSVFLLGYVSRAASIDRGIFLEAAAVGLRTREVPGTRKPVPGGLEGAVYEVRWAHLAQASEVDRSAAGARGRGGADRPGPSQTAVIAAATLGPLLAGLALTAFMYRQ